MINPDATYKDLAEHDSINFWSILLFTGYLSVIRKTNELDTYYVKLTNHSIKISFNKRVKEFFNKKQKNYINTSLTFNDCNLTALWLVLIDLLPLLKQGDPYCSG